MRFLEQSISLLMAVGVGLMLAHVAFDAQEGAMNWGVGLFFVGLALDGVLAIKKFSRKQGVQNG